MRPLLLLVLAACLAPLPSLAQEPAAVQTPASPPAATEPPTPETPASTAPLATQITTSTAQQLVELGCSAADVVTQSDRYYAVCGKGAVWVLQRTPSGQLEILARHRVGGSVRAVFVREAQVWVASMRETAQPLDDTPLEADASLDLPAPASPPVPLAAPPPASEPGAYGVPGGRVVSVHEQGAVVSLGTQQGLRLGDRVELSPAPDTHSDLPVPSAPSLVGKVVSVEPERATLALGFAEVAAAGMLARKTDQRATANKLAPHRIGQLWIFEGTLRPFLPIEELGFALLGDLSATYLARRDMYLRLELRPLGILWSRNAGDTGLFGAYASAGYDQTHFALGLGLGSLLARDHEEFYTDAEGYFEAERSGPRFAVLQHVRLGSRDGLHFASSSTVRLDGDRWHFGWLEGAIQIPVSSRSWFVLRAGGGQEPGHVLSEVGFRRLVRGNGAGGSLFVRPSAGFSGIQGAGPYAAFVLGPMLGIQLEGRIAR